MVRLVGLLTTLKKGAVAEQPENQNTREPENQKNTFVEKHDARWFKHTVAKEMNAEIFVWRSASVHFLKNYIFERRFGRRILDWLYRLEERFPRFFGKNGTYPLIVIQK